MSIEEFKQKRPISIGLVAGAVAIAFNIGFIYANMLAADKEIVKNEKSAKEFTEQEVGGLRGDVMDFVRELKEELEQHRTDIDDLETYHKDKE